MDYEKKYKEALERAKEKYTKCYSPTLLDYIFPELKENKDIEIRRSIIRNLKRYIKCIKDGYDAPSAKDFVEEIEKQIAWLEKQGEQNPTDRVEPKFHEGDWIVSPDNLVCKITHANSHSYTLHLYNNDYRIFETESWYIDKKYHLWTIADARDGDVLFHSDSASNGIFIFKEIIDKGFAKEVICYCDYDSEDHFCLGKHHTCCWTDAKILYPATKEQCDTLFAKMKEAGYTFDFEKKELKKIEKQGEQEFISSDALIQQRVDILDDIDVKHTSADNVKPKIKNEIEIPFGAKDSELQEATYYIPKGFYAEIDNDKVVIKKGEKPTAWSKKDEKMFEYALNMIEWYSGKNEDKSRFVSDWLKSIKDRVGCEVNCTTTKEWSEEDERNMQNISLNLV